MTDGAVSMALITRIRAWLHWRGIHQFCRTRVIPAAWPELLRSTNGDVIDVTNQAAVDRRVHY